MRQNTLLIPNNMIETHKVAMRDTVLSAFPILRRMLDEVENKSCSNSIRMRLCNVDVKYEGEDEEWKLLFRSRNKINGERLPLTMFGVGGELYEEVDLSEGGTAYINLSYECEDETVDETTGYLWADVEVRMKEHGKRSK